MEEAKIYYITTMWSIAIIAKLMNTRYETVREYLFNSFPPEFNEKRRILCYAKAKYGASNPQYGLVPHNYQGACSDGKGYLTICKPEWYTGRKKYSRIYQHHVVMCEALGITEIPRGFVVHHLDRKRTNNNLSNLALMILGAHSRLHMLKSSETIPSGSKVQENLKRIVQVVQ